MSFDQRDNTARMPNLKAKSSQPTTKVDIAELKAVSLPPYEKSKRSGAREQRNKLRDQLLNDPRVVAVIADDPKRDSGVAVHINNPKQKRGGEIVSQPDATPKASIELLSAFAGKPLREMPPTALTVLTPGRDGESVTLNGRYPNARAVRNIELAMFQMPQAPGQETGQGPAQEQEKQSKSKQTDLKGDSPEVEQEKTVSEQFADLVERKFSTEELAKTLANINKSSDPKGKEVIGVFVKPAYYQGSNLVPDSVVLQPMRFVGAAGQGRFQIEVTKADAMKPADYERAREILGVSKDFPLDAKFSRDFTNKEITVRAKNQDSFGNGGLSFNIDRFDVGSPMTTIGFIRRTPAAEPKKESGK